MEQIHETGITNILIGTVVIESMFVCLKQEI